MGGGVVPNRSKGRVMFTPKKLRLKMKVLMLKREKNTPKINTVVKIKKLTKYKVPMPSDEVIIGAGLAASAYVAQQLFGKTLAEMGDDLNKVYKANRDKLLVKAAKKVVNPEDGAVPNLRVARDVIWNGAVTDDEVCSEYFGGILAASRSVDGKDDSALIYVDCIKALSAKQLHLHFVIYNSIHNLLLKENKKINPGMESELQKVFVWFSGIELQNVLAINISIDLNVLHRQGLLKSYVTDNHVVGEKSLYYTKVEPTTFGVLLYAASLNNLAKWQEFGQVEFPTAKEIQLPKIYTSSLEDLSKITGLIPSVSEIIDPSTTQ